MKMGICGLNLIIVMNLHVRKKEVLSVNACYVTRNELMKYIQLWGCLLYTSKGTHSARELTAIQKKYDMKMTVYIFTSIMAGEKERAIQALRAWQGEKNRRNMIFRTGLKIAYRCV